jgi:hypothetical protein
MKIVLEAAPGFQVMSAPAARRRKAARTTARSTRSLCFMISGISACSSSYVIAGQAGLVQDGDHVVV